MLKLIVGDEKGEVQNATIPVRWCADKETLDKLKELGVVNPYILIVVVKNKREISRQIAPLDHLVEYVKFESLGENKIFATIIWSDKGKKGLWKRFLRKDDGNYRTDVLYFGDYGDFDKNLSNTLDFAEVNVMIPTELFADYPEWEKKWVNLWFSTRPKDQCHYRRRRIMAYTIQPPAVFLYLLFVEILPRWIITILLVSLGFWFDFKDSWNPKKWRPLWNFRPLFRPWKYGFKDLFSVYFKETSNDALVVFYSVYLTFPLATIYTVGRGLWKVISFIFKPVAKHIVKIIDKVVVPIMTNVVAPIVFNVVVPFVGKLLSKIPWEKIFSIIEKLLEKIFSKIPMVEMERKWETPTEKEKFMKQKYTTYQTLLCENLEVEVEKVVPFAHKIHLKYQDLKASVCKPMSR